MIDIRTHIYSMIAVFLALAIGIIIGVSLQPGTQRHMANLIAELNSRIDNVLSELNHDRVVVKNLEDATGRLYPSLVAGKLTGKRVAVVRFGSYSDDEASIADAITTAGGTVVSTTVISPHIETLTQDEVAGIRNDLTTMPATTDGTQDVLFPVVKALVQGSDGDSDVDTALQVLISHHLAQTDGDYSQPVTLVVIDGGYQQGPDDQPPPPAGAEAVMAQMLTARNVTVVGCEPEIADESSIPSFQTVNISTVDCIDHAIGKIDLDFALAGEGSDYGWKSTATRLLPKSIDATENQNLASGRR